MRRPVSAQKRAHCRPRDTPSRPRALSTAGPLKLVTGLDDTFLVMNGDVLTTLDYAALVRHMGEERVGYSRAGFNQSVIPMDDI